MDVQSIREGAEDAYATSQEERGLLWKLHLGEGESTHLAGSTRIEPEVPRVMLAAKERQIIPDVALRHQVFSASETTHQGQREPGEHERTHMSRIRLEAMLAEHFVRTIRLMWQGAEKSRVNFRTIRLSCPLFLTTCSYFLAYLPTLTLFSNAPIHVVVVCFTYFWNFRKAGKTSHEGQTCTSPGRT